MKQSIPTMDYLELASMVKVAHTNDRLAYRVWASEQRETRYKVASAWYAGQPLKGANVATDGSMATSYGWHRIARTLIDGTQTIKVAFDCHYSTTTAKQCGPFKAIADMVVPCESCQESRANRASGRLATNR